MIDFYSESLLNKLFETNARFNTKIDLDKLKKQYFMPKNIMVSKREIQENYTTHIH
ncbi:putative spoT-like ppGpp hydrolase [Orientia tsutsugamushi str. TA763]|nr:putative spoT-like ppGpp hydrolase [Orientia tsutsugamushi str. TA763]